MPEPTPDSESQSDTLERVLDAAAPLAEQAQQRLAAAEEDVRKYAQLDLVVRFALMILDYPAVDAIGYTTERSYAEADRDQPYYELHGTVAMNPDVPDTHQQEVHAESELDNLLAGAGFALAARVFDANPGESATLPRDRLEQRANAISNEWQNATGTA
jgi:hypothetical protein